MQSSKEYLRKNCSEGSRHVKRVSSPYERDNLFRTFKGKTVAAIKAMDAVQERGVAEWVLITSYYAKYGVASALLAKVGLRTERHDCTIELMNFLFGDTKLRDFAKDLGVAQEHREGAQYGKLPSGIDPAALSKETKASVLEVEEFTDKLSPAQIAGYGKMLDGLF